MAQTYVTASDPLVGQSTGTSGPRRQAAAVTPDDANNLTTYAAALYIGVTGDVKVTPAGATDDTTGAVTFKAHPVGYMPMQVRRVWSTGTTATNILALI